MLASSKRKHSAGTSGLPDLPFGITSFGAALVGRSIYVCEGQLGPAHQYSRDGQSDQLLRLDLTAPRKWEVAGTVPRRAGLAMVAYDGKAYRIGGFEARNKEGEADDLHSTADVSRFDPATGRWDDLPPLPAGRSSHDAVVVGSHLYVVGGWDLRGSQPSIWHDTALQMDLSAAHPTWTEIPKPPFHRRAFALGECRGKLYALGGMQEKGGLTTTSDVLDLATGKWSPGPKLPGEQLEGFGGCAVSCAGHLYATTYSGKIWRLSEDGASWQEAGQLARPRFFHRMLVKDDSTFLIVGGANMTEGKDLSIEVIPVAIGQTAHR
jgi:N-acetylneuraminic acid mutarotase